MGHTLIISNDTLKFNLQTDGEHSLPLMFDGEVCINYYNSPRMSVFEAGTRGIVWYKDDNRFYSVPPETITRILLKMEIIRNQIEDNRSRIKNL